MLSFLLGREQTDIVIEPGLNKFLESDDHTIWFISGDNRYESITTANAIDFFLEQKLIEELP
jgi:hypothetical protein